MTISKQLLVTCVLLIMSILLFDFTEIDLWIQDYFFNFERQQWILDKDDKLIKFIFYDGIKKTYIVFVLAFLTLSLFFRKHRLIHQYKQGIWIVCLSTLLIPLLISALKANTNIPCPKDIRHYGGNYPYVTVLSQYPDDFKQEKNIKCYPAGHASGGFALLSLFFLFKSKRAKIITLVSVMGISWSIGFYKILIGDHFLGHTMVTMLLAWLIILIIHKIIYSKIQGFKIKLD